MVVDTVTDIIDWFTSCPYIYVLFLSESSTPASKEVCSRPRSSCANKPLTKHITIVTHKIFFT